MTDAQAILQADLEFAKFARLHSKKMTYEFISRINALGLIQSGELAGQIRERVRILDGAVDSIDWRTSRYGLIKASGIQAQTIETRNGRRYHLSAKLAQNWITPVFDANIPMLAQWLAITKGNSIVKSSEGLEYNASR